MREVNKAVLQSALHQCKGITLDIDATEVISHRADAKWTYNKHKGYMPMVGHAAQNHPKQLARHRTPTPGWRLYAMAAKVVKIGRPLIVKLQTEK